MRSVKPPEMSDWRDGNLFELLAGRDAYVPALLQAIESAERTICMEQYLVASGRFADLVIDLLIAAAARGVDVRLLIDAAGSNDLSKRDRVRLIDGGVRLRLYNPLSPRNLLGYLARNHRKVLLVDRRLALPGGYCITDDFLDSWYDIAVLARGPVVEDWRILFEQAWHSPVTRRPGGRAAAGTADAATSLPSMGGRMTGRVCTGAGDGHDHQAIRQSLHRRMLAARRRIWLCTPYFLPTPELRRLLCGGACRGVDVRIIVASGSHDHPTIRYAGESHFEELLESGAAIYRYQPNFMHAKYCLVDDWCTAGSCNFDFWGVRWNLEANQEVHSEEFGEQVADQFIRDCSHGTQIFHESWLQRPWSERSRQWLYGATSRLIRLLL